MAAARFKEPNIAGRLSFQLALPNAWHTDPMTRAVTRFIPSRGFVHSLFGVALTIFSWYSPWAWPAWPALTMLDLIGGDTSWLERGYNARAAILTLLIMINVGFWAVLTWLIVEGVKRLRR